MDAYSLSGMMPAWESSSLYGGLFASVNSRWGAAVVEVGPDLIE